MGARSLQQAPKLSARATIPSGRRQLRKMSPGCRSAVGFAHISEFAGAVSVYSLDLVCRSLRIVAEGLVEAKRHPTRLCAGAIALLVDSLAGVAAAPVIARRAERRDRRPTAFVVGTSCSSRRRRSARRRSARRRTGPAGGPLPPRARGVADESVRALVPTPSVGPRWPARRRWVLRKDRA